MNRTILPVLLLLITGGTAQENTFLSDVPSLNLPVNFQSGITSDVSGTDDPAADQKLARDMDDVRAHGKNERIGVNEFYDGWSLCIV